MFTSPTMNVKVPNSGTKLTGGRDLCRNERYILADNEHNEPSPGPLSPPERTVRLKQTDSRPISASIKLYASLILEANGGYKIKDKARKTASRVRESCD